MPLDFGDFSLGGEETPWYGGGGGFNLGGSLGNLSSGGGGFDWGSFFSSPELKGGLDLAKFGLQAGLGVQNMLSNKSYQNALQKYYQQKSQAEQAYNAQVQDYLKQKAAWEGQLMGTFTEQQGAFGEAMAGFQEAMSGAMGDVQNILQQELSAAAPLISQSQQLLEPAVAALAKGEVPAQWQPLLDAAKQKATAAAMQNLANAGIDASTAAASIQPQVDQMAHQMMLQLAATMSGQGLQIGQQGLGALGQAAGAAGAEAQLAQGMLSPIMQEYLALQQVLAGLFGGFPGLAGGPSGGPPPPVA